MSDEKRFVVFVDNPNGTRMDIDSMLDAARTQGTKARDAEWREAVEEWMADILRSYSCFWCPECEEYTVHLHLHLATCELLRARAESEVDGGGGGR